MHAGDLFYFGVGLAVWLWAWPAADEARALPPASEVLSSWVGRLVLRNLLLNIAIYEFWHQLLYGTFATESTKRCKYSAVDPYEDWTVLLRERLLTTCGFIWSSAYEVVIIHWWAARKVRSCGDDDLLLAQLVSGGCLMEDPASLLAVFNRPLWVAWFLFAIPLSIQFRGIHFFFVHRGIHPWRNRAHGLAQGDIGAFLYRHVHSWHHKSHNPGPWSSLSMHPVEHLLYFSCFLLALLIPFHPLHLLLTKYHTDISALAGHDGYGAPGGNDVGHYLHHAHFECNYGFSFPNYLDRLFGYYEDGTKYKASEQSRSR